MADDNLNPDLIAEINRVLEQLKSGVVDNATAISKLNAAQKTYGERIKDVSKLQEQANKLLKQSNSTVGDFAKELLGSKNRIKDLRYTISNVDDALEELGDSADTAARAEREKLIALKSSLVAQQQQNDATKAVVTGFRDLGGAVLKGVANSYASAAKTALGGGDALATAGAFMTASIDTANAASQAGSKALGSFGEAAMLGGGKMKLVGVAAQGASAALGFLSNTVSELAKAGIGFMIQQTQKNIQGFQGMASAGALYSGGMMEMLKTSGQAGLTLEQMSKAVGANTEAFAQSGMGVGEGSRKMAAAMQAGGKAARDSMFALGMSMEEQAGAYAQTMALMAGPSGQLKASNAEVAQQTREYAGNLKLISDITGKDAKARMEKLRQDNDTLAFNTILNGMDEKERLRTQEAMALMSEQDQRAFREQKIYGSVISKDLAIEQATNSGIAKSRQAFLDASNAHNLTVETVGKTYKENADETMAAANEAGKSLGLAREGAAVDAAKAMNANAQYAVRAGKAYDKGVENLKEMANPLGPDGKPKVEVDIQAIQQDFALKMQDIAMKNMPAFATAITETIKSIEKSVEELAKLGVAAGSLPPWISTLIGIGSGLLQFIPSIMSMLGIGGGAAAAGGAAGTGAVASGAAAAGSALAAPAAVLAGGGAIAVGAANAMKNNEAMQDQWANAGADAGDTAFAAAIMGGGRTEGKLNPGDFIKFGGGTGDQAHFDQLDPTVRSRFMSMAQAYYSKTGKMLQINSAFRTAEEQAKVNSGNNPKAAPGKSLHNVGRALDINSTQVADLQSLGMLGKYGFGPLAGDPPHIQALDGGGSIEGAEVALVGEKGPELVSGPASVTSRSDTSELFNRMNSNLEAMLRVLQDQHSTSEKILYATS
jgi:hypothetical protein